MKFFTKLTLSLALLLAAPSVANASYKAKPSFNASAFVFKGNKHSAFNSPRLQRIDDINAMMSGSRKKARRMAEPAFSPNLSFENLHSFGDIDGPNDEVWFFTSRFVIKEIPHYDDTHFFTEYFMLEYVFDIYDSEMKLVGTVHDKVRYQDDEIRVANINDSGCTITPIITKHFFNDDDKYEVIVGLAVNSTTSGLNHYRNLVYSLGGEKEMLQVEDAATGEMVTKEFDKPINVIYSSIGDVLDASVNGEENYYITTYSESLPDESAWNDEDMTLEEAEAKYWDLVSSSSISFQVLGKADNNGNIPVVFEASMPILAMPGNQESTPFMFSFMHDGKPYIAWQKYKDIFWNPYYSTTDDLSMKESNALMIEILRLEGNTAVPAYKTELAFTKTSGEILASFYSIGDMRYREDINFGGFDFNADGSPAYFITNKDLVDAEHGTTSYFVYDADGKRRKTLMRNADSTLMMSNLNGFEPQQMFVQLVGDDFLFNMVDLYSGNTAARFSYNVPIDVEEDVYERVTSNMDRILSGDTYIYFAESGLPLVDENDNNLIGVVMLDKKGNYINTEYTNFGVELEYAQLYLSAETLNPYIFDSDANREYMALIKYPIPDDKKEEHVVVAKALCPDYPEGKELIRFSPCEKGVLSGITPYFTTQSPMLLIIWNNDGNYTSDIYFLPFGSSAVAEIESEENISGISFDGTTLHAAGQIIQVFNLQGINMASGFNTVDTTSLPSGLYVATANGKACKFTVK